MGSFCLWRSIICLHVFSSELLFVVCSMVFNATFNNISVISWWSVLLVEVTGRPGENHRPVVTLIPLVLGAKAD